MLLALLTLISGLAISAVAIYYSVQGLAAIFAAAVIPIVVMGTILEVSKLVAAWWLKANWHRAPFLLKSYLLIAVVVLMLITSMGIFGFLSKAHTDQAVPAGDVVSQVALYDEKIKTQRDNIETARKALLQMDAQVDQLLGRSADERGAERAVQVRRNQARERARLQSEIAVAQTEIAKLNEQKAPIAGQLRALEAEVGPIKYIAALIYGDNPDSNVLEKAVTWVIMVIVFVFDPLAVLLLLASQLSFQWYRQDRNQPKAASGHPGFSAFYRGGHGGGWR
jgi:flagellar basal body-associated protein FliL